MTPLDEMAAAYGLVTQFENGLNESVTASPETTLAALRSLGVAIDSADQAESLLAAHRNGERDVLPPVVVAWDGELSLLLRLDPRRTEHLAVTVTLETGDARTYGPGLPERQTEAGILLDITRDLPLGYHRLHIGGDEEALVLSAPRRAYWPSEAPGYGVFLPLYALRSREHAGPGHFGDLGRLLSWTREQGGRVVGTLPLLASFLDEPFAPSPYTPVTRRAWNELYLDLGAIPELGRCPEAQKLLASFDTDTGTDHLDYRREAARKRRVLELLARTLQEDQGPRRDDFEAFRRQHESIESYALFRGAARRHGIWHTWPEALKSGALGDEDIDRTEAHYHAYAQWIAHEQIARLGPDGLYLDLPLGVHPDGFDAWQEREVFCQGMSVGAPPDGFFVRGQDWGFPPLDPVALRRSGYRYWIESLRFHMRFSGLLRIDHVMAFERLYWVPHGANAREGLYVRYPIDELFAVACLESSRAGCGLVGEDLGTVTDTMRSRLDAHGLQRMYVLPFEVTGDAEQPLRPVEPNRVASLGTHDTVPFAAWQNADDVRLARDLELIEADHAEREIRGRQETVRMLEEFFKTLGLQGDDHELVTACLGFLGRSDSPLVLVNLEDLWGERRSQNVPGTTTEHANWTRHAAFDFESFSRDPRVLQALRALDRERRSDRKESS
ncbi:MAG: 4-alpha-glucanotransferase [Planctomycetota bacterium]